jgi:hypothetical protein
MSSLEVLGTLMTLTRFGVSTSCVSGIRDRYAVCINSIYEDFLRNLNVDKKCYRDGEMFMWVLFTSSPLQYMRWYGKGAIEIDGYCCELKLYASLHAHKDRLSPYDLLLRQKWLRIFFVPYDDFTGVEKWNVVTCKNHD